jgi:hypothetical protein
MSQASIVLSNGNGASVRAAINAANEAMTTRQAGSSAPSPTYPYMEWADTANNLLKQRNAANSDWITKGVLSAPYGGIPASAIPYDPGSPALLAADNVQDAIDLLASSGGSVGTWTPAITFDTAGNLSVSYSSQVGNYIKIGRMVVVFFNIQTSAFTHSSASGNLRITGLPFTCDLGTTSGTLSWQGITKTNYTTVTGQIINGQTYMRLTISGSGQATDIVDKDDTPSGGNVYLIGFAVYRTAA